MARPCGYCKGRGGFEGYSRRSGLYWKPCKVCGGSGFDPNWLEKPCSFCRRPIEYRFDWDHVPEYCAICRQELTKCCGHCGAIIRYKIYWQNVPDYCEGCRQWKEKRCANPNCHGTVRYKVYWNNIPDYCDCKGWSEKACANPNCGGKVRFHAKWGRIPDYCEECRRPQFKQCANPRCGNQIRYMAFWDHIPKYCKECGETGKQKCQRILSEEEIDAILTLGVRTGEVTSWTRDFPHISPDTPYLHVDVFEIRYNGGRSFTVIGKRHLRV